MFYEVKLFKGIFDMGHYFRHSCIQDLVWTLLKIKELHDAIE